jgi:exodeoxyribonuclease I
MQNSTFLWHDYETFGVNPRSDRPAQFAAVRTDMDLNEIGEPIMLYCKPAADFLPDPYACLITGITPQICLDRGIPEPEFAARIEAEFAQTNTIGVGYNTIRFDDEVTRFLLWRNLMEPYAREWQNGCGRWDLLDVVRTAHALRPDGLAWPAKPEGGTSFKLEDLSAANGLVHTAAHDALSDVRATIALARALKTAQPRLFEFCLGLHRKDKVMAELGLPSSLQNAKPFWHVSGMFGAARGCLALMWPLAMHPHNRNELLAWDLSQDPSVLAQLNASEIRTRLFTKTEDLPEGVSRLPLKSVHLNKSPMVMGNLRVVSAQMAERWGIEMQVQLNHAAIARELPDMSAIWPEVYARAPAPAPDVDEDLYGGFIQNADRHRLNEWRELSPERMAQTRTVFDDERLTELVFRYRARNFPHTLSADEESRWYAHRVARLEYGEGGARTGAQVLDAIDQLSEQADERSEGILGALVDYVDAVMP